MQRAASQRALKYERRRSMTQDEARNAEDGGLGEWDYGAANIAPTKIPPRTLDERLHMAIHWSLSRQQAGNDPYMGFAAKFVRELGHVGLKLIWEDGGELAKAHDDIEEVPPDEEYIPRDLH
jgi:hypothetical protein